MDGLKFGERQLSSIWRWVCWPTHVVTLEGDCRMDPKYSSMTEGHKASSTNLCVHAYSLGACITTTIKPSEGIMAQLLRALYYIHPPHDIVNRHLPPPPPRPYHEAAMEVLDPMSTSNKANDMYESYFSRKVTVMLLVDII
jgi:hypothetical protein